MEDFKLEPARDHGLSAMERYHSPRREDGLIENAARLAWWGLLRTLLGAWNRLHVAGWEHLPSEPPFVLVANHASHLDALLLTTLLPMSWRDSTYPIAACDVFYERLPTAAFTSVFMNAFPLVRGVGGVRGLRAIRQRVLDDPCVLILFPEGTRSRNGEMKDFKSGVGMLVAETPIPVIPCYLDGAADALPVNSWWLRPHPLSIRVGPPQRFDDVANNREGWAACAAQLEGAVRALKE